MYRTRYPRPPRYHSQTYHHPQHQYYQQHPQQATDSLVDGWLAGGLTSRAARDRPDSIADFVYNLQQAVSTQMGASSSRDLRAGAGPTLTAAAAAAAAASSPSSSQHSHQHRHKKSHHRSHYRGSDTSSSIDHHQHQGPTSDQALPPAPAPAPARDTAISTAVSATTQTSRPDDDDIDNVNEGHNNFVVLTSSPGSAAKHQTQPPSLQRLVTPSSAAAAVAHSIKVVRLKVAIDKRLTVVDERSPAVLKYKTPHFRALATVEVPPLVAGQRIQIGWIQVCRDMTFVNSYGKEGIIDDRGRMCVCASTSWEFPEIIVGKYRMISDADGKQYPWYGSKTEVQTLEGPTLQPTHVTIHMNDNFFPQVTWYIPHSDYSREPTLEFIYRKQRFYTFLALRDLNTNVYQILKTVAWMMELSIKVDPSHPLGERAKVLGPLEQERPYVLDEASGVRLEKYALNPPNANNSQVLVWRPRSGEPKVIVPPVQTTLDIHRYLAATRDQFSKLRHLLHSTTHYPSTKIAQTPR